MALGKILVGCDPELFLREKGTNTPVSAYGLLPGTKKEPFKCKKGAYQIDGMAVEFNIDPADNVEEFSDNIDIVLAQVQEQLPKNLELTDIPTAIFDQAYFDAQPEAAREMGCEPDYNAYTGQVNPRPKTDKPMRTAGGHIHTGFTEGRDITDPDLIADAYEVVKQMDFYVGLPSLEWDSDTMRRNLYGGAGACRVKPYGVEYRPLSCRWVLDKDIRKFVFNATVGAIQDLYDGKLARLRYGDSYARDTINSGKNFSKMGSWDGLAFVANLGYQPFFKGFGDRYTMDKIFLNKGKNQQKFGQPMVAVPDIRKPFVASAFNDDAEWARDARG